MIVLGADTHKRTHALAAVDAGSGAVRGQRSITADEPGHLQALRWARELDDERVWAIEDCRHVSRRLELALIAAGERVVRVAPQLMGQSRQGERQPGKSDQIDALAVARAVVARRRRALPGGLLGRARDGDPPARRSPQRPDRRTHPHREPAALASRRTRARSWKRGCPARCLDHPIWLETRRAHAAAAAQPATRACGSRASWSPRSGNSRAKPTSIETELRALVRAYRPRLLPSSAAAR